MRDILIAIITGLLSSVIASYVYAYLVASSFTLRQMAIWAFAVTCLTILISLLLPRVRLAFISGITGYYPHGQKQYIRRLRKELTESKTLKIIGARGLDLVGERSPIGASLEHWQGELDAFLINPASSHVRLRVDHLAVEREKYQTECKMVDGFLGVLALRHGVHVTKYEYDGEPIFRAIILDNSAYVSVYQSGVQGRLLPCFRLRSVRDPLYMALIRYTTHLKENSTRRSYQQDWIGVRDEKNHLNEAGIVGVSDEIRN